MSMWLLQNLPGRTRDSHISLSCIVYVFVQTVSSRAFLFGANSSSQIKLLLEHFLLITNNSVGYAQYLSFGHFSHPIALIRQVAETVESRVKNSISG